MKARNGVRLSLSRDIAQRCEPWAHTNASQIGGLNTIDSDFG